MIVRELLLSSSATSNNNEIFYRACDMARGMSPTAVKLYADLSTY